MIYYAPTMFASLGLSGNTTSLLATGVYGIVNCLSTIPAIIYIDRLGRRPLLMFGAAGTCISLVIVGGIIGAYGDTLSAHPAAGWAGIAFIYIYDINFSYSFGKSEPQRSCKIIILLMLIFLVYSSNRLGPSIRNLHSGDPLQGHFNYDIHDLDV
jgi:MFS family permease